MPGLKRQTSIREWMETKETNESQVRRRFRKFTLAKQRIPLFFNFESEFMFKQSDLENTDWWSLCHDPSKSVKPRKIRANASSQLSFQMLARQQKNRINKLEMIKNA